MSEATRVDDAFSLSAETLFSSRRQLFSRARRLQRTAGQVCTYKKLGRSSAACAALAGLPPWAFKTRLPLS